MEQLAAELMFETQKNVIHVNVMNPSEVRLIKSVADQIHSIFYRNQLIGLSEE